MATAMQLPAAAASATCHHRRGHTASLQPAGCHGAHDHPGCHPSRLRGLHAAQGPRRSPGKDLPSTHQMRRSSASQQGLRQSSQLTTPQQLVRAPPGTASGCQPAAPLPAAEPPHGRLYEGRHAALHASSLAEDHSGSKPKEEPPLATSAAPPGTTGTYGLAGIT
jgi:hypothetical protein